MTPTVKQLAELAKETEVVDSVVWNNLKESKDYIYEMMASNVIEQFGGIPEEEFNTVAMATITRLLIENFLLNVEKELREQNEQ